MFCIGSIISTVYECRVEGVTQAKIATAFLKCIDKNCEWLSNEDASNLARGCKNPSPYVMEALSALSDENYKEIISYFESNIINLIKENEMTHAIDALALMILEDESITDESVVNVISRSKKEEVYNDTNMPSTFLAGLFLYALKNTKNSTNGKAKRIAQDYLKRVREGSQTINRVSNNTPTEKQPNSLSSREIELMEERIDQEAVSFIMKYDISKSFIPICQIISITNLTKKHDREMYNEFCLMTKSVRNRILEETEIAIINLSEKDWWYPYLSHFEQDYRHYKLGDVSHLYAFGQYFPKLLEYGNTPITQYTRYTFPPKAKRKNTGKHYYYKDMPSIIDEYMYYTIIDKSQPDKERPLDYFWRELGFYECPEIVLASFLAVFIIGTCESIPRDSQSEYDPFMFGITSIYEMETAEDLFYLTLLTLYETYSNKTN